MLGYESDGDQYDDEDDGYRAGVADISVTLEHFVDVDAEQFGRSFRTTLGHCPDDVKSRSRIDDTNDHRAENDRLNAWNDDMDDNLPSVRALDHCGFVKLVGDALNTCEEHQHHERRGEPYVGDNAGNQ